MILCLSCINLRPDLNWAEEFEMTKSDRIVSFL